jgi:hypothetical protein
VSCGPHTVAWLRGSENRLLRGKITKRRVSGVLKMILDQTEGLPPRGADWQPSALGTHCPALGCSNGVRQHQTKHTIIVTVPRQHYVGCQNLMR